MIGKEGGRKEGSYIEDMKEKRLRNVGMRKSWLSIERMSNEVPWIEEVKNEDCKRRLC